MSGARPDTWMPVYIGDYLADTMHLGFAEHGAYLLLIFAYWRTGGPLPDDDKMLSGICRATPKQWRDLRPTLVRFFQIADGVWRHKRIEAELVSASEGYEKRRAAAMQRWNKADAMHEQPQPQSHSNPSGLDNSALSAPMETPPNGKSKRGTRLAANWEPDLEDRAFAEQLGLDADAQAAEFRDYWCSTPGQKGCKLDWSATWRNRCRDVAARRGPIAQRSGRAPNRQGPNSLVAAARAVAAQIEGER